MNQQRKRDDGQLAISLSAFSTTSNVRSPCGKNPGCEPFGTSKNDVPTSNVVWVVTSRANPESRKQIHLTSNSRSAVSLSRARVSASVVSGFCCTDHISPDMPGGARLFASTVTENVGSSAT